MLDKEKFLEYLNKHVSEKEFVLDVGSGDGKQLFWVEEFGFIKMIGIDLNIKPDSNTYFSYCKEEIDLASVSEKIATYRKIAERFNTKFEFILDDFFNVKIENDYFSCVLSSHLLHLLDFRNHSTFLTKIYSALKVNGIFIMKCNNIKIKEVQNNDLYFELHDNVIKGKYDEKTMYLLNHEEIKNLLIEIRFEILEIFELNGESLIISRKN